MSAPKTALSWRGLARAGLFVWNMTEKSKTQIKSLARTHSEEAVEVLVAVMKQEDGPATARVVAAQAVLDRAFGKVARGAADEEDTAEYVTCIERVIISPGHHEQDDEEQYLIPEHDKADYQN